MTLFQRSEYKISLVPAEELVPIIDWYDFLLNVADRCLKKANITLREGGYRHDDKTYWRVLVFMVMNHLNVKDASDDLDDLLWDREEKRGRPGRPKGRKKLGGKYPRRERLTPNESQVNEYRRDLAENLKVDLVDHVFNAQIEVTRELGLIKDVIEVYVDYTNEWYYGKDEFPSNPFITGVNNGPGTSKARKFCALMISSGSAWLFAGVFLTQKGKKKAPDVADAIQKLHEVGFTIKRVFGDREFSNYDLIARLHQLGIPYTGTIKKSPNVKKKVDKLLTKRCKQVAPHTLNPHAQTFYKLGPVKVHLIMKTDPGKRVRDVQRDLKAGNITLAEARKKIHVFVTTEQPPREKKKLVRWGINLATGFRRRWRIETGFRDANRFFPTSHARSNGTKVLMIALRMFTYNAWQIERARRRRLRRVPKVWKKGPTLQRFCTLATKTATCA